MDKILLGLACLSIPAFTIMLFIGICLIKDMCVKIYRTFREVG
jgi:hypothetical protein